MPFKLEIKQCESTSIQCSSIPKQNFFKGSQNSPAWSSGNSSVMMKVIMDHNWKNINRKKTAVLIPVTVSSLQQNLFKLESEWETGLRYNWRSASQPASPSCCRAPLGDPVQIFFHFLVRIPWPDGWSGHCECYLNNLSVRTSQRALCVFTRTNNRLMPYRRKNLISFWDSQKRNDKFSYTKCTVLYVQAGNVYRVITALKVLNKCKTYSVLFVN